MLAFQSFFFRATIWKMYLGRGVQMIPLGWRHKIFYLIFCTNHSYGPFYLIWQWYYDFSETSKVLRKQASYHMKTKSPASTHFLCLLMSLSPLGLGLIHNLYSKLLQQIIFPLGLNLCYLWCTCTLIYCLFWLCNDFTFLCLSCVVIFRLRSNTKWSRVIGILHLDPCYWFLQLNFFAA